MILDLLIFFISNFFRFYDFFRELTQNEGRRAPDVTEKTFVVWGNSGFRAGTDNIKPVPHWPQNTHNSC